MTDIDFMRYALSLAEKASDSGEVPVGAVIVRNGEIVGQGRNRRENGKNALYHAEIEAINDACQRLGGWRLWECDMFVTLEPCPMCTGAIINSRIRKVVFGAYDKKAGCCGSVMNMFELPFNHKPEVIGGFMEEECSNALSEFFIKLRNTKKLQRGAENE